MAGTVPTITPGSITGISGKDDRPVYFLKLNHSAMPNLAVKGDAETPHSEVSIKWGSKLMKNVQNSLVNTKIMTPAEIAVFKQAAMAAFANNTTQYGNVSPGAPAYCWVKMPFVPGLSDADFINEDATVNLKQVKELIQKFSDAAVWSELGRVVAVDIFNGNNDRFVVNTSLNRNPGDWVNRGNIMFLGAGHGHTTPVIGLDTFDPNSDVNNLQSGGGFEGLKVLIDSTRRDVFAKACATSVGKHIKFWLMNTGHTGSVKIAVQGAEGPAVISIPIATMEHLFDAYATDFNWGIVLGASQLKQYLETKVRQYAANRPTPPRPAVPIPGVAPPRPRNLPGFQPALPALPAVPAPVVKTVPQGILDRMAYLGW